MVAKPSSFNQVDTMHISAKFILSAIFGGVGGIIKLKHVGVCNKCKNSFKILMFYVTSQHVNLLLCIFYI